MSRSTTAKIAAAKHKKRPPSALHPNSRRTRNADPRGLAFMAWCKRFPCVACWASGPFCRKDIDGYIDIITHPWEFPHRLENEFAHYGGTASAKANNRRGFTLCTYHHRGCKDSQENLKKRYGAHIGVDIEVLIQKLNAEFDRLYPPGTKGLLEEGLDGG